MCIRDRVNLGTHAAALAVWANNQLSNDLSLLKHPKPLDRLGKWQLGVNVRPRFPFTDPIPNDLKIFGALLRELATVFTCPHANHRKTLDQRNICRDCSNAPAGKSDDQQSTIEVDAASAFIKDIPAHRIINNIGSPSTRQRFDLFAKSVFSVDNVVSAVSENALILDVASTRRNDRGTQQRCFTRTPHD